MANNKSWHTVCHKNDLLTGAGVCALVNRDEQVAIFLIDNRRVYSIANWDPIGQANVLSRGITGDEQGEIFVASPLYKQRFSLTSGHCLDDDAVTVPHYPTRIKNEQVQILA
ncbi:nitrite reductase small subunit NirD [Thalassomonas viridans]|uniref:Nitrite reductase small subunit NirD n=1 Tax=Thalassomonas viridans TaxID=137584 RepID=A0AAE9Z5R8_9GAMM|nr:nitrite reductase small subunit NirD [Thalassomonas viridans]WDE05753.1 nitrite reductase small subunit NirD [Thalassomonas viridans]